MFKIGVMETSTQFAMFKFVLCSNLKFKEGIVHESSRSPADGLMFRTGDGVVCQVYIGPMESCAPPPAAASLHPSAEEATALQLVQGTLFEAHVSPESEEV